MNNKFRLVMKTDFWVRFYQVGFWVLFSFIIGVAAGNYYSERVIAKQLHAAVFYKAIEIEGQKFTLHEIP